MRVAFACCWCCCYYYCCYLLCLYNGAETETKHELCLFRTENVQICNVFSELVTWEASEFLSITQNLCAVLVGYVTDIAWLLLYFAFTCECNVSGCACFFLLENILITFYCYFFCRIVLLFYIRLYIFRYFAQAIRKASNFHMHMYVSGTVEYIHWLLAIYISTYHRKIEKQTSGSDDEQKITEQNNKFK